MKRALLAPATLATVLACSKTVLPPKGELVLVITTDMAPPNDFDEVHLEIARNGSVVHANDYQFVGSAAITLPATFGIVVGPNPAEPIAIRVIARKQGHARVLREIKTTVPADRVAELPIPIQWLCDGHRKELPNGDATSDCDDPAKTCIAGSCTDATVDPAALPPYDPAAVFGGGTGHGDGACFDTLHCFQHGTFVTPATDCTIQSSAAELLNVGIFLPASGPGICAENACVVPLDQDPLFGWTKRSQTIRLPAEVCRRLYDAYRVIVSTDCPTKAAPTCGAWSATGGGGAPATSTFLPDPDGGATGDGGTCAPEGAVDCLDPTTPRRCVGGQWQTQPTCPAATPQCAQGECVTCVEGSFTCSDVTHASKCVGGALVAQPACTGDAVFCSGTTGCADRNWSATPVPASKPTSYVVGKVGAIDTVTDTTTGLVWQKAAPPGGFTFPQATQYCASLSPAGAWRLPTIIELVSLLDFTSQVPAAHMSSVFSQSSNTFWSATPYFPTTGTYWTLEILYGTSSNANPTGSLAVRCVQ